MPAKTGDDIQKPSVDLYIVASLALWAGDFELCEEKLKTFAPLGKFRKIPKEVKDQEEMIQYIGGLRQMQISQKKGEYNKLAKEISVPAHEPSGTGLVISTKHLRGVIWRLSSREFQLLAYMSDLSWERQLFAKANELVHKFGEEPDDTESLEPETVHRNEKVFGIGGSWVISGNPFLQVQVSDMGQIEAESTWIGDRLPSDFTPIKNAFRGVLLSLDERD